MTPDQIVQALEASPDAQHPALILCASEATRQQVMRELLAARGAWAGLRVQTLSSAARTLAARALHRQEKLENLPEDHVWSDRLAQRPLLRQQLAEHVEVLHRMVAVGLSIDEASAPLRSLVEAGWAVPEDLSGWVALLNTKGPVYGVGFAGGVVGTGCGRLGAVEAHVLDTLGIARVEPGRVKSVDAIKVTDVASEARTAVAFLQDCTDGLVLVADAETGERVAATLRRNGLAVAEDGAAALKNHALVTLLRRLVPCFESEGHAEISATDLIDYLIHPALSRRSIQRDAEGQEEQDEEVVERSNVRDVRKLLRGTRRYHATVAEWLSLVETQHSCVQQDVAEENDEDKRARLQRMAGTIAIVKGHLQALIEQVSTGTLGGMGKLLSHRRLSNPSDRLGYAIMGALGSRSTVVANRENLDLALSGATSGVRVGNGITVLRYQEYDGRISQRLVLLDVHHKGLGKAPTASPLLKAADYSVLGVPTPTQSVDERMAFAHWAASQAGVVHAVVSHVDSTGRRVVPPAQLPLNIVEATAALGGVAPGRYGHDLPLAEAQQRKGMVSGAEGTVTSQARAQQVAAEWVRAGYREISIPMPTASEAPQSLLDYLDLFDVRPVTLRPWLGQAGVAPGSDDGLPTHFRLSATSMETFTNCMYVAWVQRVLGIREPETLDEDVNSRELGTATHAVLESYVKQHTFQLVVPTTDRDARRTHLVDHCVSTTEEEVKNAREAWDSQEETPAVAAARHGLTQRWQRHWGNYAATRIASLATATHAVREKVKKSLGTARAKVVVQEMCPEMAPSPAGKVATVMLQCLAAEPSFKCLQDRMPDALIQKGLEQKNQDLFLPKLQAEPTEALKQLIEDAAKAWQPPPHPDGDGLLLDAELSFGNDEPATLTIGRADVMVRGSIDSVVEWKSAADTPSLHILDFKTGSSMSGGKRAEVTEWLTKPQLIFYALAVRAGLVKGTHDVPISAVGYDMVKDKLGAPIAINDAMLDSIEQAFGALIDRARDGDFPPIRHPRWSPFRYQSDIVDALRLRPDSEPDHTVEEGS